MKNQYLKKWLTLSALFLFVCFSPHMLLRAQSIANYSFSTSTTGSLDDLSSGSTSLMTGNQDDAASSVTPLGFNFMYMGINYGFFSANSNGQFQFHTTSGASAISGSNITSSTAGVPNLFPMTGDNEVNSGMRYKVTGTAPNRKFVLEWTQFYVYYNNLTNAGNMQLWLDEATGRIDYVYGEIYNANNVTLSRSIAITTGTTATTQGSVTVGASPTYSASGTLSSNTFAAGSGTSTGAPLIANLGSSAQGARRVYSFTPTAPTAPTSLNFTSVTSSAMTLNWTDNATNETGYNIYRSLDGTNYTLVTQLPANSITYSASGLTVSTLYYWKVASYLEIESAGLTGSQATTTGTLSGIKTVGTGGDYDNLTIAFAAINANGLANNVELQLISGYPAVAETYPILSCNNTATGLYSVKVYPTVSGLSITSGNATGTLSLNGATNVTFDGRVNQTGVKDLIISNTNAGATSYAVQFVNDSKNNTLQYLTLQSSNTGTSSGTIVFGGSTGTTGNDNNLIDNCDVKDGTASPLNGIYSAGASAAVDNSGNIVSNSNIYNYFAAATASNGILLASNSSSWTINANRFFQTATRTLTGGSQHRGINVITSNGNGYVITNNIIGYANATGTGVTTYTGSAGRFFGIEVTASTTGTASSIQGNTITGLSLTTTSGTVNAPGVFAGISVLGGTVSIGDVTPNTIGASSGTGSILVTSTANAGIFGIHAASTGTLNIANNIISAINATGSAAGISCGMTAINTTGSSTATTITGNTIGGSTANSIAIGTSGTSTANTAFTGIATANAVTTLTISGNTVNNVTNYGNNTSSTLNGIASAGSPATSIVSSNTISNTLLAAGTLTNISSASPTALTVNGNSIFNASVTGASGTINGVTTSGATTASILKNKIYNLSAAGTGSSVNGILASGGTTANIYNNAVGDLKTPTTSAADAIRGISITSTSATTAYKVYYNTVYLNATSSGANFGTSGIFHTVNATATTASLDLRNNIIINESTPAGTGIAVAYRRSGTALGNYASTSNRNMFYAGTPSASHLIMYNGTTPYQTMLALQAAVLPREVNSITGEATYTATGYGTAGNFFISLTGSSTDYLKPVAGIATQVESGGANITSPSITDDYAGSIRAANPGYVGTGTNPDMGAFEFAGLATAPVITLNSVTPPTTTQCTATARLVSVDITTLSGTITGATIGYTVNGVPQTNVVMTNTTGSTWVGTIPVPTPANATIAWGVAASNSGGLNGSYTGTSYSDQPLFGTSATATASTTTTCAGNASDLTANLTKIVSVPVGTSTNLTTDNGVPTAFCNRFTGYRMQTIYTAAELTALGFGAGTINSMSYNIATIGSSANNTNVTIKIGTTALSAFTDFVPTTGYTTVFTAATYTHAVGINTYTFSTPYTWDGVSNLVIEVYQDGVDASTNSQTYYTSTPGNTTVYSTYGAATGTTSTNRLNVTLTGNMAPAISGISWSDGIGTVGTTNPLTVNPTVTTTYTATVTASGCTVTSPGATVTVNPLPSAPTATNSAQCGFQIPTASVTSTTGLPTPTFKWYDASTGGTLMQTSTSTTYTTIISTTTTFYVSELNTTTGCEGPRTAVVINVSTPDPVAVTASSTSVCLGSSVTLTGSNTSSTPFQSYTFSFQSTTTGSGAETAVAGNPVTITPTLTGTFVYTATGTDGGCAAANTVSITVSEVPAISSATATPATVCSNTNITLQGQSNITTAGSTAVVGAGASTSSSDYYIPFYHLFGGQKDQYIIRAAELTAAGLSAGNITALGLNITTVGTTYAGFTLHVGNTANTTLSAGFVPLASLTQVYSNPALSLTASSLNTFTFSTPFNWDGTSNIVVQTSWSNNNSGGSSLSSGVAYDNTSYTSAAYHYADNTTPATMLTGTFDGTSSNRPKMTFTGVAVTDVTPTLNWVWTPGTGLNTATATTSISNTTGSPITQAFTVTATNAAGCSATATTTAVTINPATVAPTAVNSTQCGQGIPTASVTGSGTPGNTFQWYTVSTGGTAIAGETGSTLSAYTINTTTTFYVAESNGTCQSDRVAVTVTVTTPPAITVSGTTTICNGSATSLSVSSSNDPNYTYTWTGGLGTGAAVSASPAVNTTYTVTATDASGGANNGCITNATYAITVNPLPQSFPVTPATATICDGSIQQLTSGSSVANGTAILGTGTTAPSQTAFPNPLSAYFGGTKHQMLYTVTELTAQGMSSGSKITTVTFDLKAFQANACTNFTIRMGNTGNTALSGFVTGTSTVYGPTTFTPSATGLVTFTLTTPYIWDGTSNIIVETVHNAGNTGNGQGTRTNTTTTTANTVFYGSTDNVAGGIAGFDALTSWTSSGASTSRPNVRFAFTNNVATWSPMSSLYTNAGATTAYAGTNTNTVYAKPSTTTTYVATYTGSNGCTSQSTATITVKHPTVSTLSATACSSYTLNTTTYNTSGTYTQVIPNAAGCDSTITLNLTITQPTTSTLNATACSSYTLNGTAYNTSGTYTQVTPNAAGCDSTITLNLIINQPTTSTLNATACDSYTLNGTAYTTSGTYTQLRMNAAGCDSTITLNLTINNATSSTLSFTGCDSFTYHGTNYTSSGTYNQVIPNAAGCDSLVTLNITINHPTTATISATACTSYTWAQNGTMYTTSGLYNDTIPNAAGCDSVITLDLTVIQPTTSTVLATACSSYMWAQNGMTYMTSGMYNDTVPNSVGCDSIITLNLTINQPTTATVTTSACGSYVWAQTGMTYNTSGMYNDTINNAAGCDSIITLNLTINNATSSTLSFTDCGSFTFHGMAYTSSGTYNQVIPNAAGCDSLVTLNVTIHQPTTSTVPATGCGSYVWAQTGMTYNASGMYNDTITNAAGCDSIITLNLTINQPTTSTTTITQCGGSYTWTNGTTYNASGTYTQTLMNAAGCDSTATLVLTINALPVATATVNSNATITASAGNSYQWINCATGVAVAGATAQTFVPSANGSYAVVVSNGSGCVDTSACVTVNNVGIKENTSVSISVFPNPTHNEVTITMDASSATIQVVDAQGKLLQTTQVISGGKVDLSTYETGVYFLRITTEYGSTLERIVKN